MTYYRVEFTTMPGSASRTKKFRTKETAEKYAKRVLGPLDESAIESKVAIVAVNTKATPIE